MKHICCHYVDKSISKVFGNNNKTVHEVVLAKLISQYKFTDFDQVKKKKIIISLRSWLDFNQTRSVP